MNKLRSHTDLIFIILITCRSMDTEIIQLKEKIKLLENQNSELQKKFQEIEQTVENYEEILSKVFTRGQIKKLKNSGSNKRVYWSAEDIASAISLRSVSPKAYRYLKANNFPLPAMSTLRKWVRNIDVSRGCLTSVISVMKKKAADFSNVDRLCVLTFDEIYVSNKIDIDKKK